MNCMKKTSTRPLRTYTVNIWGMCIQHMLEIAERNVQDVWFKIMGYIMSHLV